MTRHSRTSEAGIVARHLVANRGASIVIAVIVLVTTFIAAAAPRALDLLFTAELRHTVSAVPVPERDLVATSLGGPAADMGGYLATLRAEMGPALRAATGDGRYVAFSPALLAPADEPDRDAPNTELVLAVDPLLESMITITGGSLPATARRDGEFGYAPIPFVVSEESARQLRWSIGEQRTVRAATGLPQVFELAGTFAAADSAADYWAHNPAILEPSLYDDGNSTPVVTAVGYVAPESTDAAYTSMGGLSTRTWYPVSADGVSFTESTALLTDLREFTSRRHTVPGEGSLDQLTATTFTSGLIDSLEAVQARAASTAAVLSMAAAGPLGVLFAVLALAATAVIERRRAGLTLAGARGASASQLRRLMALEGLILGVPAALLGSLVAWLTIPAAVGVPGLILPAVLALAPALLLGAAASGAGMRTQRADLGTGTRGRTRLIIEVVIVGLAALSVFLLLRRGLSTGSGPAVDPLLAATPLLLALAVCVVVLRVYPYPLRAIESLLARGTGLTGFLGAARAVRAPAAGLAPVLAMVVGVSIAVFSGVLVTTIDRGVDAAARATVGADLQVTGPVFGPSVIDELDDIPGVTATAGVDNAGPASMSVNGAQGTVTVLVADLVALRELRGDSIPDGMDTAKPIAVIVSSDLAGELPENAKLVIGGASVAVAGVAPREEGLIVQSRWVMVDKAWAEDLTDVGFQPRIALVGLDPGASSAEVTAAIVDVAGAKASVLDQAQAAAAIRSSPAVGGLAIALVVAMIVAGVLSALAVIMTSVVGARARNRLLALLATLGISARQARGLAAWEIAPIALTAILAGTLLGVALPWVVLGGVDLTPFTGGSLQPAIAVDAVTVGALVIGFIAVVVVSVAVAVAVGRRTSAATTLRMGEEG